MRQGGLDAEHMCDVKKKVTPLLNIQYSRAIGKSNNLWVDVVIHGLLKDKGITPIYSH